MSTIQSPFLKALPDKTSPAGVWFLFLFFRQDLGVKTMKLMLFFFPSKQFLLIESCGAGFHLAFRSAEEPAGEDGCGWGGQGGQGWGGEGSGKAGPAVAKD